MRLLIADKLHPRAIEELSTLPLDVLYEPELTKETLQSKLPGVGILIVRSTEVTAEAIDTASQLHLIVRAGAEYNTIDVRAASRRGIYVANCPGKNAGAVAELVFGLLLGIDRRIPDAVASLRAGRWERAKFGGAEGLHGKTIGIAGFGAVGREVALRARGFGMHPVAFEPLAHRRARPPRTRHRLRADASKTSRPARRSSPSTCPSPTARAHIVGAKLLAALPPSAILHQHRPRRPRRLRGAARGGDEARLRVGLDVLPRRAEGDEGVPRPTCSRAPARPGRGFIYGTPHIAAVDRPGAARHRDRDGAGHPVVPARGERAERRERVVVRRPRGSRWSSGWSTRSARSRTYSNVIKRHGINVEEVTNTIFEGGGASCAKLRVVSRLNEACLAEIHAFEEVLHVDMVPLPNLA